MALPTHPELQISVEGPVGRIVIDAPDRLNAVDLAQLDAMTEAVRAFDADPEVRVIVVTGSGRGFCAGANLAGSEGDPLDDRTLFAAGRLVRAMVGAGTPVLSLVNGVAAGVGLSIALAADYCLATGSAKFVLAFSNIGLMPDGGGTGLVTANIGRARALRMALTAEKVDTATAERWGLVSEVVADEDFAARGQQLTERLAWLAPRSVAHTKSAITQAAVDLEAALLREEEGQSALIASEDFATGVDAFFAKRTPTFRGR
jgi:enoyl-CoA hydratase/carnithine racemase